MCTRRVQTPSKRERRERERERKGDTVKRGKRERERRAKGVHRGLSLLAEELL